jgi:cytochrome b561
VNQVPVCGRKPYVPADKVIYGFMNGTHDVLAYVFSGLGVGHILFALFHAFIVRDGVLSRTWVRVCKV